jgi:hypothetical protein
MLAKKFRGRAVIANSEHDAWCGYYRGRECSCMPNSFVQDGGGDVLVVESDGGIEKLRR